MITRLLFAIALFLPFLARPACADQEGDFYYTVNGDEATITGLVNTNYAGPLTIPDTLGGLPVTRLGEMALADATSVTSVAISTNVSLIGAGAFYGCSAMTNVTIPEGVTVIGNVAFYSCTALARVTIPDSVTSLNNSAFENCTALQSVSLSTNIPLLEIAVFYGCAGLTNIVIPESVTVIRNGAFLDCSGLTRVEIPDSVTNIESAAFSDCSNLAEVSLPAGLIILGERAFSGCSSLRTIAIPAGVTEIGTAPFSECTSLTNLAVAAENPNYADVDGVLFDHSFETLLQYPGGRAGSYAIPDGVTTLGDSALAFAVLLTDLTIPASLTTLGDWPFEGCVALETVAVESGNPSYASMEGLLYDVSLEVLLQCPPGRTGACVVADGALSIADFAFNGCKQLKEVTVPGSVETIGNGAFAECSNLERVNLTNGVLSIGEWAFGDSPALASIFLPASISAIGAGAFSGCAALTAISVDAGNPSFTSVDGVLFDNPMTTLLQYAPGKLGPYSAPHGISAIGDYAFELCAGLTELTLPASVTTIGVGAFTGCRGLTRIYLAEGLEEIGDYAFSRCDALTSVTLPASVVAYGQEAFSLCAALVRVFFLGNAPIEGSEIFSLSDSATVYYMPGSTGWAETYEGRPALLWNPAFTSALRSGGIISCVVTGTANIPIGIEYRTNLLSGAWMTDIALAALDESGRWTFQDTPASGQKFYRVFGP